MHFFSLRVWVSGAVPLLTSPIHVSASVVSGLGSPHTRASAGTTGQLVSAPRGVSSSKELAQAIHTKKAGIRESE